MHESSVVDAIVDEPNTDSRGDSGSGFSLGAAAASRVDPCVSAPRSGHSSKESGDSSRLAIASRACSRLAMRSSVAPDSTAAIASTSDASLCRRSAGGEALAVHLGFIVFAPPTEVASLAAGSEGSHPSGCGMP
ncbi:MAG: hypothetical protein ACO3SJ_03025, partial [Phycisphaerales bacterium]